MVLGPCHHQRDREEETHTATSPSPATQEARGTLPSARVCDAGGGALPTRLPRGTPPTPRVPAPHGGLRLCPPCKGTPAGAPQQSQPGDPTLPPRLDTSAPACAHGRTGQAVGEASTRQPEPQEGQAQTQLRVRPGVHPGAQPRHTGQRGGTGHSTLTICAVYPTLIVYTVHLHCPSMLTVRTVRPQ